MKSTILVFISLMLLTGLLQCTEEPDMPRADFVIQKDTIIENKKQRIEVDKININEQVYFVSKSNAMFNSVWPGDSLKVGKTTIFHDYNLNTGRINLQPISKTDSTMVMKLNANQFQGIPLPSGTVELAYTFNSTGSLTVTWIATNCTSEECITDIKQKTIIVE